MKAIIQVQVYASMRPRGKCSLLHTADTGIQSSLVQAENQVFMMALRRGNCGLSSTATSASTSIFLCSFPTSIISLGSCYTSNGQFGSFCNLPNINRYRSLTHAVLRPLTIIHHFYHSLLLFFLAACIISLQPLSSGYQRSPALPCQMPIQILFAAALKLHQQLYSMWPCQWRTRHQRQQFSRLIELSKSIYIFT